MSLRPAPSASASQVIPCNTINRRVCIITIVGAKREVRTRPATGAKRRRVVQDTFGGRANITPANDLKVLIQHAGGFVADGTTHGSRFPQERPMSIRHPPNRLNRHRHPGRTSRASHQRCPHIPTRMGHPRCTKKLPNRQQSPFDRARKSAPARAPNHSSPNRLGSRPPDHWRRIPTSNSADIIQHTGVVAPKLNLGKRPTNRCSGNLVFVVTSPAKGRLRSLSRTRARHRRRTSRCHTFADYPAQSRVTGHRSTRVLRVKIEATTGKLSEREV